MTIREMYVELIKVLETGETEVDRDELTAMVRARLEKHDAQNEKRKMADRKPSAKELAAREYDAKLMEAIQNELTDEFHNRGHFAAALDITENSAKVIFFRAKKKLSEDLKDEFTV